MSVVSASQFALSRARRDLKNAFSNNDWQSIKDVDKILSHTLNNAFDDANRDTKSLVDELEKIVSLYSEMVSALPNQTEQMAREPLPKIDR